MDRKVLFGLGAILAVIIIFAIIMLQGNNNAEDDNTDGPGIANPAATYCVEQGGEFVPKETSDGTAGYCRIDGKLCEEWEYFRSDGQTCKEWSNDEEVTDFNSCVDAGYPVMESYPRQCRGSDGKTYTENIEGNVGDSCEQDSDCILPADYAIRSICPYEARCVEGSCQVICPWDENDSEGEQKDKVEGATYCTEDQRNAEICTMEYRPVCGWFDNRKIKCETYPCSKTYSNPCMACADENVEYWTEGECPSIA